jgi:simple sugar transport system permease protein
MILTEAFISATGVFWSGNVWVGTLAALIAGGLVALCNCPIRLSGASG